MANNRVTLFFHNLQQDLKVFIYFNVLLMLFRITFLFVFSSQLADASIKEIEEALWYGFRISLKTAGIVALSSAILATIPNLVFVTWWAERIRKIWSSICIVVFTFAFVARIPYYTIFNSGYNLMLLNGAKDDWHAIYDTAVSQYQLWPRLLGVVIISSILIAILRTLLITRTWLPRNHRGIIVFSTVLILPVFMLIIRFGGSYSYANSIHWENAAKMNSNVLNEAILDDGQAIYRGYSMYKRLEKATNVNITASELKEKIALLGGNPSAATVEEAFTKKAEGPRLQKQPQNIIFILGENYALWPFLPSYKNLGLVQYGEKFLNSDKSASIQNFVPNAGGTIGSVEGMVTGFPEASLYTNYQEETYKTTYASGIGNVMKKLGYKTCFWYGGFGSWQNIKKFSLSQGFDEYHGADEFEVAGGNSWGVTDGELFAEISNYMKKNHNEKTFHFILTTSNHPPFTIDVDSLGFKRQDIENKLPNTIDKKKSTLDQLGHIWYADQMMGKFVENTEQAYPDTLFVLTGDHAERFSFAKEESNQANFAVPCIFYGTGVEKSWFDKNIAGSHMQIIPTLVEMLAPTGFQYVSFLPSFYDKNAIYGFNSRLWTFDGKLGMLQNLDQTYLQQTQIEYFSSVPDAAKLVGAWRVKKGNNIN